VPQQTYPLLKIVECGGNPAALMVITHFDPINHCQRPARDSERIIGAADSTTPTVLGRFAANLVPPIDTLNKLSMLSRGHNCRIIEPSSCGYCYLFTASSTV
jgi:hypothetical protein